MFLNYPFKVMKYSYKRSANSCIRPLFINFLLTYHCNSRCLMCHIWGLYAENPALAKEELTLRDIESFIIRNRNELSDLRNIGLTGGDPLLMRGDFVEIVRVIKGLLPEVHLGAQTNGLIPELAYARLKEILSFCPDFSLAVSIDGIGQTHSLTRGVPEAFEKAAQTIKYAKGLGIQNITCGMTLNKYNYKQIRQVKDFTEAQGAEFSCFPAEVSAYFNNTANNSLSFTDIESGSLVKQLREYCAYHYFMDNLRLQLEGKRLRRLPCFSGFTSLVIDPYGNVKPCVLKVKGVDNDIFGNIKERPLKEMLASLRAKEIKAKVKECSCWCQCEVSSSAVVAPLDIFKWLIFYCPDRAGFFSHFLRKKNKYAFLL